ncbi:MAG: hypothetical protein ACI9UV_000619 [Algoriphagus sp.]
MIISYSCPISSPCSNVIDDGSISRTTIIEFTADCTWNTPEGLLEFEVLAICSGGGGGAIHARANIEGINSSGIPAGTSYSIGNGGVESINQDDKGQDGDESRFDFGGDYEIIAGSGGGSDDNSAEDGNDGQASSFNTGTTGFSIVSGINFRGSGGGGGPDRDGGDEDNHSGGGRGGLSGNDRQDAPNDDDGGDGANGRQFSDFDITLNRFFGAGGGGGSKDDEIGFGGSSSSGGNGGIEDALSA